MAAALSPSRPTPLFLSAHSISCSELCSPHCFLLASVIPPRAVMSAAKPPPAADPSEVHPDLSAIISPEDEQVGLTENLSNLIAVGVPVHTFTRDRVQAMFMNVSQYLKAVRNLTRITDEKLLSLIFVAAIKAGIAPLPQRCDEKAIYTFAQWSKKGAGARALAEAQYSIKIEPGFSAVETSNTIMLERQLQDMISNRKEIRDRLEEEILQHQRIIDGLRRRMDNEIRCSDKTFYPGNAYAPLDKTELSAQCWARFVAESKEFQKLVPAWSVLLRPVAEEKFSAQIQREHKATLFPRPGIMKALKKWAV